MNVIYTVLSWILGIMFFMIFLLCLFSRHYLSSIVILIIVLLLIPPLRQWIADATGIDIPAWLRGILIPALAVLSVFLIFRGMGNRYSIYRTPETERRLMAIYDDRMARWPVPFEERYIDTSYGKVFVVISGPEDAPPVLLLHASAMGSWSWLYNIRGLAGDHRTYAIDTIGDAGRSVLADIERYPDDGESLALLYSEIMDSLGVRKACFVGASQGGFIATNVALHAPRRVSRLVLCGPMGYTGTNSSVLRILFTTMFPLGPVQKSATRWAFGDDPAVNDAVDEWFSLILEGVISRQARPRPFTPGQLESIDVPVLLLLGAKDGLVGDPQKAGARVRHIPEVSVSVLDTGHLMSAEEPERFNALVRGFIDR